MTSRFIQIGVGMVTDASSKSWKASSKICMAWMAWMAWMNLKLDLHIMCHPYGKII